MDIPVEIADLVIRRGLELQDVVLGEGLALLAKAGGGLGQLLKRPHSGAIEQDGGRKDRDDQQNGNKDEALPQEQIALIDHVGHVNVHTGDSDGLPRVVVHDRYHRGKQPAERGAIGQRRDLHISGIPGKFRDWLFNRADVQAVLIRIHEIVGRAALTVLVIDAVHGKQVLDDLDRVQQVFIVVQQGVFRLGRHRLSLCFRYFRRLQVVDTRSRPEPVLDDLLVVGRFRPSVYFSEFLRVDLIPEVFQHRRFRVARGGNGRIVKLLAVALVRPLAEEVIADQH